MELFIQVDDDGKPVNHPMLLQSIHWIDPNFDPENPPPGYVRFKRIPPPDVGYDQTYDVHYKWIDGVFTDVYMIREMTDEEKYERDLNHQVMLQRQQNRLEAAGLLDSIPSDETTALDITATQTQPMKLGAGTPTNQLTTLYGIGQEIPTVQSIVSNLVCFSDQVTYSVEPTTNEISAYYTSLSNDQFELDFKNIIVVESKTDLPATDDVKVGTVYSINTPRANYAWSGTEWVKISDETKPIPTVIIDNIKEYVKQLGS